MSLPPSHHQCANQTTQRLWCTACHREDVLPIDDEPREWGWNARGTVCPNCVYDALQSVVAGDLVMPATPRPGWMQEEHGE